MQDSVRDLPLLTEAMSLVRQFHEAFRQPSAYSPRRIDSGRARARADWMEEEIDEFLSADSIADQADGMIDLIYFALGTLVEMGIDPDPLFLLVQKANMSKLWPDGSPRVRPDGKTIKPPTWCDPTEQILRQLVRMHTKYELVIAEPFGCVAACLEMTAAANNFGTIHQQQIACHLPPAVLPASELECPDVKIPGVHLGEDTINACFVSFGIGLREDYLPINRLDEHEFADTLRTCLLDYSDLAIGFDASVVYPNASGYGHVCLVAGVDERDHVLLVDPGPKTAGIVDVAADVLYLAVRRKSDGIWRFTPG